MGVPSKLLSPDLAARARALRHDLHRHPELGFQERRTQAKVKEWLTAHGWDAREVAGTGLMAERAGSAGDGPTIAIRADLDALPIRETTELEYRSVHEGVAHKCGHDGHTSIVCALAAVLDTRLASLRGKVRLLFQPAEEGATCGGGGGRVMVEEGALDGVDQVFGLHNWPGFPKGEVRVITGTVMAQEHRLAFTIRGRGGHASEPQRCVDPIAAGVRFVQSLYALVARSVGLGGGAVLSITEFHAGTANNIIPDRAQLTGTIRSLDDALGERLAEQVRHAVTALEQSTGVTVDAVVERAYPAVVNDPGATGRLERAARRVLGDDRVSSEGLPLAAAEDFAYMAAAVPGCYFLLGAGDPVGVTPGCHHPDFDFDDELLEPGAAVFLAVIEDALAR